jgi:hypothetical protein
MDYRLFLMILFLAFWRFTMNVWAETPKHPFEMILSFDQTELHLQATIRNVSDTEQFYLQNDFWQPVQITLTDGSGKEVPFIDIRSVMSTDGVLPKTAYQKLPPKGSAVYGESRFKKLDDGSYELQWQLYIFRNIHPGTYRVKGIWKSEWSGYVNPKENKTDWMEGMWKGTLLTNELTVTLP